MLTIACHRKKKWVEKSKTQKSLGVSKNTENEHNENNKMKIRKSKMPVRNLLDDDNSLPQEKKLGQKGENSEIFRGFKKYRKFRP